MALATSKSLLGSWGMVICAPEWALLPTRRGFLCFHPTRLGHHQKHLLTASISRFPRVSCLSKEDALTDRLSGSRGRGARSSEGARRFEGSCSSSHMCVPQAMVGDKHGSAQYFLKL